MSRKGEKKILQCDKRMWRHGYSKDNVSQSAFFSLFLIVVLFFRGWEKTESNMLRNSRSSVEAEAQRKVKNVKS